MKKKQNKKHYEIKLIEINKPCSLITLNDDNFQHQWSQFPNKKIQTNRLYVKTKSILLLHPRYKP